MVNAKKKGNRGELEIAKLLSKALGVDYKRVPMSGAFSTINKTNNPVFRGDIFTEDERYNHIVIECKNYKEMKLNDLFNEGSNFHKWIDQSMRESEGHPWILFVKANRGSIYCIVKMTRPDDYCIDVMFCDFKTKVVAEHIYKGLSFTYKDEYLEIYKIK